jgi:hypothetical protein
VLSRRGLMHFLAAVLPKEPICALKLGDRTSLTDVSHGELAWCRCMRRSSTATPPSSSGGVDIAKGVSLFFADLL